MHFLLIFLAWLAFECGVVNLVYEAIRYTTIFDSPEDASDTVIRFTQFFRWLFSSLGFTVWYYILFVIL